MHLKSLYLKDFRNYDQVTMDFDPGINVFIGDNAQGKTNLIEAIYMLSLARSHRTAKEREVIRFGADFARIEGRVAKKNGEIPLSLTMTKKGKIAKLNRLQQERLSDYIGAFNVVLFAPEDLELVKGAPQLRRTFIDRELSQMNPTYLYDSSNYQHLLKQRNTYLKQLQRREAHDKLYLNVLTEQLVDFASRMMVQRFQFIQKLEAYAKPIHAQLSMDKETLTLAYQASLTVDETSTVDQLKTGLMDKFQSIQEREIEVGSTQIGPQRDDLKLMINDKVVQQYGSQGQQRTTVLSLKLAEIECMHETLGEYPILLLDDVLSELDDQRQTHLLKTIEKKVQTFLTTTSMEGIQADKIDDPDLFTIKAGQVELKEWIKQDGRKSSK